jgi:hypothetical protein
MPFGEMRVRGEGRRDRPCRGRSACAEVEKRDTFLQRIAAMLALRDRFADTVLAANGCAYSGQVVSGALDPASVIFHGKMSGLLL